MRKILLLTIGLLAMVAAIGSASTALGAGEGIISGQVVNKTRGGSSAGELEVTLTTYTNDKVASEQKVIADTTGKFEFKGLSFDTSITYSVRASFQDADYSSEKVSLKADIPTQTIELAVYDSTTSDDNIQVSNGHMVVYLEQGFLQVLEVWRFSNTGNKTYIGTKGKTARATLKFTLPQGASSVNPGQGFAYETSDTGIVDTAAIPPGITDVNFSYVVPYQGSDMTISRKTDYRVANFGLFVQDTGAKVKSVALAQKDTQDLGGTKYLYFTAQNLSRGVGLDASITGLPKPSATAPSASFPWPWLAVGVGALSAIMMVAYPRLRKRRALAHPRAGGTQPLPITLTPNEENALLRELAQLDDDYEAGKIRETEYQARRAQIKAKLIDIYALTRGHNPACGMEVDPKTTPAKS